MSDKTLLKTRVFDARLDMPPVVYQGGSRASLKNRAKLNSSIPCLADVGDQGCPGKLNSPRY